jgi:hypothetical protein
MLFAFKVVYGTKNLRQSETKRGERHLFSRALITRKKKEFKPAIVHLNSFFFH